jgi:predicted DNA-binding protein (UPF0251 family)
MNKAVSVTKRKAKGMPRPMRFRRVWGEPGVNYFKPAGVPMRGLLPVILTLEEFEAVRLIDSEDLTQTEAAKRMGVSQPTFQRIYESARKKIADSLVNGRPLRIEGGHYRLMSAGRGLGPGPGRGRGFGRRGGRRA